ncbi:MULTISPECIES: ABC transporter ATP-binding protein [unclassified Clostridioides]|uniref:ABC transporter ATP-binding protein n=1 Tax=unclassified Clostridioides TaxID=2635829 RepID=UPI00143048DC|nr:ABC transporter ATP-binding protein [Clostridioides difficile]NJJ37205.1 ABC transporter ATP-binding protein [Clostridioides difficile]NJK13156.1 ABC transporter ATP-binding protein [Clostridioides difficile]
MNNIIEAKKIIKEYTIGKGNVQQVLKGIDLSIQHGEFISIMGSSGSGKSTLLHNISGMDKLTSGTVKFSGEMISNLSEEALSKLRLKNMGFIFQQSNLLKNLNIFDNIIISAYLSKEKNRQIINEQATKLMEKMNILEIKDKDITQVSGGQLQRASICRALINDPKILFGDEPTGALNSKLTNEVMDILIDINQLGTAIMLVTHDVKVALKTERVLFMSDGMIVGEIKLGKFNNHDSKYRENKLMSWLSELGF